MEASPTIRRLMLTLMLEHNVHTQFSDDGSMLTVASQTVPLATLPLVYMIAIATNDVSYVEFRTNENANDDRDDVIAHHEAMLAEAIDREANG